MSSFHNNKHIYTTSVPQYFKQHCRVQGDADFLQRSNHSVVAFPFPLTPGIAGGHPYFDPFRAFFKFLVPYLLLFISYFL